ncbi:unnamed protein product [Rotaria magnacalcarata]|nr:unnamed protein product [Rotaria magnacalcarata]
MQNQFEGCTCVWLGKNAKRNKIYNELRHVISSLHIFDTSSECDNYIRASTKEKVVFVISNTFNESTIARLHDLPQLVCCYVLCCNQSEDFAWANQYSKIYAKKLYADKPNDLACIELFEREYTSNKAIWWYSLDCFLYRLLNRALRNRDFDLLFALRFFITDLALAIKHQYEQYLRVSTERDIVKVFRGQCISSNELQLMLDNVNEFISMNSFFSTSRDRRVAMSFLQNRSVDGKDRYVLFEITIDSRLPIKPFADIKEYSEFAAEDEVLITLGALYRIDKIIEHPEDGHYVVQLCLASDNDYRLKEIYDYLKQEIQDEYTLDSLGKILRKMGEYQHALKYYDRMIHETQIMLTNCHMGIGRAMYGITSYDNALKHYEACLTIRKSQLDENHADVGISYSRVGAALCRQGEMRRSLENLNRATKIQEQTLSPNSLDLAETYNTLGLAYFTLNNLQQAANYFQKALDIRIQVLPQDHRDIGFAYNNLSRVLENDEHYEQALTYAKKALAISLKILPPNHPDVERIKDNIRRMVKIANVQILTPTSKDDSEYLLVASLGMD